MSAHSLMQITKAELDEELERLYAAYGRVTPKDALMQSWYDRLHWMDRRRFKKVVDFILDSGQFDDRPPTLPQFMRMNRVTPKAPGFAPTEKCAMCGGCGLISFRQWQHEYLYRVVARCKCERRRYLHKDQHGKPVPTFHEQYPDWEEEGITFEHHTAHQNGEIFTVGNPPERREPLSEKPEQPLKVGTKVVEKARELMGGVVVEEGDYVDELDIPF